ncbi:MAG TPA: hypothetical protein VEC11_01365 [Allosphingosinicella sp.]|nr:hypothetical protein [Allosphingosinicella sp.]
MRMLYIMGSSLALTLGLRIVDPPVASAISPPATVQSTETLVIAVPGATSHRARVATARKSWRP